jgi:plastocyanin
MFRIRPLVLVLAALLALAGCSRQEPEVSVNDQLPADQRTEEEGAGEGGEGEGAEGEGAGGGEALTFVAADIEWADAPAEAPAGSVAMELVNEGAILHNLVIEELGDELVAEAQGGQSATGTVTLEAGDYTFYCSVPGHRAAGMEGTLTVS